MPPFDISADDTAGGDSLRRPDAEPTRGREMVFGL